MALEGNIEPKEVLRGKIAYIFVIDKTLSIAGACADAKAVGDSLEEKVSVNEMEDYCEEFCRNYIDKELLGGES